MKGAFGMKIPRKALVLVLAAVLLISAVLTVILSSNPGAKSVAKIDFSNVTSVFETFITRDGGKLMDGETEFRTVAVNAPTLLVIEDNYFHLPSNWEIDRAFQTFNQIGATAVRTYTLSIKKDDDTNGQPKHIIGPDGEINEEAFVAMDNVLAAANKYGVRLIIPFIDQYSQYPNGGIGSFAAFRGKKDDDFWTDEEVKNDFKALITNVLNRVNTVTGIAYKDDKAILAWETGNEIRPVSHAWTNEMAAHIRSIDKNHLVADGKYGIDDESLDDENIDIVSNHYYPSAGNYVDAIMADLGKSSGKKPFFVGEFGFKKPEEINEFLGAAIEGGASGLFLWSLRYPSEGGGFYPHSEGQFGDTFYAAYRWPGFSNGDTWKEKETLLVLQKRAFEIRGLDVPTPTIPGVPVLLPSKTVSAISWQESVGSSSYEIQRREGISGKWTTINANYEDSLTDPGVFDDITAKDGKKYYYRVAAQNAAGKSEYSNVIGPIKADHAIIDEIRSGGQFFMEWAKIYEKTQDIVFDRSSYSKYNWDRNRIVQRNIESEQFITYAAPSDIDSFAFTTYIKPEESALRFKIMVSSDDSTYTEIETALKETPGKEGNMTIVEYSSGKVPAGYKFIKVVFPKALSAELGHSYIGYVNKDGAELAMPARKSKQLMSNGILKDDLNDDVKVFDRSPNFGFEISNPEYFDGDTSRLCRNQNTAEYVIYQSAGIMNYVKMIAYARQETSKYKVGDFVIAASSDGVNYTDIPVAIDRKPGEGWWERQEYTVYALPDGTKSLRITYPILPDAGAADTWNPQIGTVEIGIGDYKLEVPVKAQKTTMIEDFESYKGLDSKLQEVYKPNGDPLKILLNNMVVYSGVSSLAFEPAIDKNGYSGFDKDIDGMDLSGTAGMKVMINPKGSSMNLTLQLTDSEGEPWKTDFSVSGDEWQEIKIPFSQFYVADWYTGGNKKLELDKAGSYGLYSSTSGKIFIDDVQVYKTTELDTFDIYSNESELNENYKANKDGDTISVTLDSTQKCEGQNSLKLSYNLTDAKGFAGVTKEFAPLDWTGKTGIEAWINPMGSNNGICFQIREASGENWEAKFIAMGDKFRAVSVPFNSFIKPEWNKSAGDGILDLSEIDQFSIYLDKGTGKTGDNSIYFDSIKLAALNDIDSFEYYQGNDSNLQAAFLKDESGDGITVALETGNKADGEYAMKYSYSLGAKGWAGAAKTMQGTSFAIGNSIEFSCNANGNNVGLSVRFTDADGDIWKARTLLEGIGYKTISIPFNEFTRAESSSGIGSMDLSDISQLGFYADKGNGGNESGEIFIDGIKVKVNPILDDADYYADPAKDLVSIKSYAANKDGNKLTMVPSDKARYKGSFALECTYTLDDKLNFAGATKFFGSPADLSSYDGLQYWVKPDGSNNRLVLQVKEANGEPFDASFKLSGTEPVLVQIPWHCFKKPGWYSGAGNGTLDSNDISEFSIYINMGESGPITSTLLIDSIEAANFGLLDSFENYYFDDVLQASYTRNKDGGKAIVSLDTSGKNQGSTGLKFDYDFAGKGWAGVELKLLPDDWSEYKGLTLWVKSDEQINGLSLRIFEGDGEVWKYSIKSLDAGPGKVVNVPFESMSGEVKKDGRLDLSSINQIGVYAEDGAGQVKGTLFIDSLELYR
jgi:hypothetical protein